MTSSTPAVAAICKAVHPSLPRVFGFSRLIYLIEQYLPVLKQIPYHLYVAWTASDLQAVEPIFPQDLKIQIWVHNGADLILIFIFFVLLELLFLYRFW